MQDVFIISKWDSKLKKKNSIIEHIQDLLGVFFVEEIQRLLIQV